MRRLLNFDAMDTNPSTRLPICLCLDVSGSMADDGKIEELDKGVRQFLAAVAKDEEAGCAADICVVTFNSEAVCVRDFSDVDGYDGFELETEPWGGTDMGEGMMEALDRLEERKAEYRRRGLDYYQPWLVLMSDGYANGDKDVFEEASRRTAEAAKNRKLTVFPVGIGEGASKEHLEAFASAFQPVRMTGELRFERFFQWLSQSVSAQTRSVSSDDMVVDWDALAATSDWGL